MSGVTLGFENKLWAACNKLRGNLEESEYKHVLLGLVFLKYISDSFEDQYYKVKEKSPGFEEDRDFYTSDNIFFVPMEARWDFIRSKAKMSTIGNVIDEAMNLIEKENKVLKNVLPKNYGRPEIDKVRLGELIDNLSFKIGDVDSKSKDILGRVYEYFLKKFGTKEGEFYTPPSIVKLLVNMIEPFKGRVYDPCCGSGGMFVQSAKFIEKHQGRIGDISIYGQEYTATTWRLAKMNLAIRGIDGNLGERDADTFTNDQHKDLRADYILANPPFNSSDWGHSHLLDDPRWKWGLPPKGNANYAWISHIISKLSPKGSAAFLMSSSTLSSDDEIRKNIVDAGYVKAIITVPPKMFYTTSIAPVIWVVSKNSTSSAILFIDASKEGTIDPDDKTNVIFSEEVIDKISNLYGNFAKNKVYQNIENFCTTSEIELVKDNNYVLNPRSYINYSNQKKLSNQSIEDLKSKINESMDNIESITQKLRDILGNVNE